jgi:hypothetical protein
MECRKWPPILTMYSEPGYLCQSFAKFVSDRVTNLHASLLAKLTNTSPHPNSSHHAINLFNLPPAVVDKVCRLLSQCPATSDELDPVPTTLPHHCISALLPTITYIINLSSKLGDFPLQFKSCFIHCPFRKSTLDGENLRNYQPISHLSLLSKFKEKLHTTVKILLSRYSWTSYNTK